MLKDTAFKCICMFKISAITAPGSMVTSTPGCSLEIGAIVLAMKSSTFPLAVDVVSVERS